MKVLVSPSKTKTLQGSPTTPVFNEEITNRIVAFVQGLSKEYLGKALKIKGSMLDDVYRFFQNYEQEPVGYAGASYTGQAFKQLDWNSLSNTAKKFGESHLYIMSALYGLVSPSAPIKEYRLDLIDTILKEEKTTLYEWWQKPIYEELQKEDWILNLASKEYAKLIDHPIVVTVEFHEFKSGQWKQMSTSSKQMRGRMVRYILEKQVTHISEMPLTIDGFTLEGTLPSKVESSITLVYKK